MVETKTMLDDRYSESLTYESHCMRCKHLITEGRCTAFPDGIPMTVWTAKENHTRPRKGDHGILFESL